MVGRPDWEARPELSTPNTAASGAATSTPTPSQRSRRSERRAIKIAIFANQPARRTAELRELGIGPDLIAMSGEWGVNKPDPEFYERALG